MRAVGDADLPEYPVSASERLDSHYFVPWNLRRWDASDFRRMAYRDPEAGFFGLELFFLSQRQAPVGTLPMEPDALAFLLRMPVSRWQELVARDVSPLHGWSPVACDNGQVRLAHEVVTETVLEALAGKRRNAQANAEARLRKRLGQIARHVRDKMGAPRIAQSEEKLHAISDWIEAAHPGGSVTEMRVREACNAIFSAS